MKRALGILTVILLTAALFGCNGGNDTVAPSGGSAEQTIESGNTAESTSEDPKPAGTFSAGFSRKDITPLESVPMSGFGDDDKRMSKGRLEKLTTTCIAVSDEEGNVILFYTSDLQGSRNAPEARKAIAEATGIPIDHILMTGTHTHSSVSASETKQQKYKSVRDFLERYHQQCIAAANEAIADLKPAKMYWTTADCTGYNFVKHYKTDLGESVGDNYGNWAEGKIVAHQTEANHIMYVLKFERETDKDIYMVNWRAHATLTGSNPGGSGHSVELSADFPAPLRDKIEAELDCYAAYYQGEAGNINCRSRIAEENLITNYIEQGEQVAERMIEAVKQGMTPVAYGPIKTIQSTYTGKVNHTKDYLVTKAQEILRFWQSSEGTTSLANEMGREYGFSSVYECEMLVPRASLPQTRDSEIHATKIGDFAIVHLPHELFDTLGMKIREASPTEYLMVFGYSNEYNNYIPSQEAFNYGCYEADVAVYEPGEGEKLTAALIDLLKEVFE